MGKICPRSDLDTAHMKYSIDPPKFIYKFLLLYDLLPTDFLWIFRHSFVRVTFRRNSVAIPLPFRRFHGFSMDPTDF